MKQVLHEMKTDIKMKNVMWTHSNMCNYRCSYCTPNHYAGDIRGPKDYSKMINFLVKWQGNDLLCLDITGGEPTLWPKFQDFCKDYMEAATGPVGITFTSNGARTLRYWKEFDAPIDTIGFSFHPEFASEDHYLNVLEAVQDKGSRIDVYLLAYPKYFDKIQKFYHRLKDSNLKINVQPKIVYDWVNGGGPLESYTDEMLEFCKSQFRKSPYKTITNHRLLLDGKEISVRELKADRLNQWKGWKCKGGHDYLSIKPDGLVYGAECRVFGPYGNIYTDDIDITEPYKICPKDYCQCGTDFRITKYLEK